jgi:S-adenosylmethionine decarboxylase
MIVAEDHFIEEENYVYAGKHLIVDIYGFDKEYKKFKMLLAQASQLAGAKLLYAYTHEFDGGGITGVAVLAESHISFHTWPERDYVAFDIFMCGDTQPFKAINYIKKELKADDVKIKTIKRGKIAK